MAVLSGVCRLTGRPAAYLAQLASAVFACATVAASILPVQAQQPTEYQVKAAYLANFPKFVEWPDNVAKGGSFNICVLGKDPFGEALDSAVAGETVGPSPMAAKRISRPEEALDCRVLFISSSEDTQWKKILTALKTSNVLTVSDMREFARRGGIVQFILDGSRVRFQVNLAAAAPSGLKLSSELLKLAVAVRSNP